MILLGLLPKFQYTGKIQEGMLPISFVICMGENRQINSDSIVRQLLTEIIKRQGGLNPAWVLLMLLLD